MKKVLGIRKSSRKVFFTQLLLFICSILLIFSVYKIANSIIDENKRLKFVVTTNRDLLQYIEEVNYLDDQVNITGWAFYTGCDASEQILDFMLREIYTGEVVCCDSIQKQPREDINHYYLCETNYTQCGFTAKMEDKSKKFQSGCYEILLRVKGETKSEADIKQKVDITVSTNHYITDGILTAYRPDEYDPIKKTGTWIDEIAEQGILLFYRREEGVYLYQYRNNLYWITNDNFYFTDYNKTYIEYLLWTTQMNRLPTQSQNSEQLFGDNGFVFETNEMVSATCCDYRVTKCQIPTEYSIKYFVTGYYANSEWRWKQFVHPDIRRIVFKTD